MRKKAFIAAFVVAAVLAIGLVACSPSTKPADDKTTPADEPAAEVIESGYGVSGAPVTMDAYFELRARLDAASITTAKYGDSDPHSGVHATVFSCGTCHVNEIGGGALVDRFSCSACHAWPRDLQSDMRDVTGE